MTKYRITRRQDGTSRVLNYGLSDRQGIMWLENKRRQLMESGGYQVQFFGHNGRRVLSCEYTGGACPAEYVLEAME